MRFEIENSNQFGPLSLERLRAFEEELGSRLPDPYRQFLMQHNGGYPAGGRDIYVLHHVYGLHDGPGWAQFPDRDELYGGTLPPRMLPIADDPGGNQYCLSLDAPDRGCVYFWDHECAGQESAFDLLARNFTDFLEGLAWRVIVARGDMDAICKALADGFEADRPVYGKRTLLDFATAEANLPMLKLLIGGGGHLRPAAIIEGVRTTNAELVKYLIAQGLSVNFVVPETGFTPLMLAASRDAIEVAKYLMEQGADPTPMNKWGKKALDLAHTPAMKQILG